MIVGENRGISGHFLALRTNIHFDFAVWVPERQASWAVALYAVPISDGEARKSTTMGSKLHVHTVPLYAIGRQACSGSVKYAKGKSISTKRVRRRGRH